MGKVLALVALLLIIPACFPAPAPSATTPPVIVAFNASPDQISYGGSSTLLWNVTGATAVQIDQGTGSVALAGTQTVSPATSTTYTITASNAAGTRNQSVTVTVTSTPSPPPTPPTPTPPSPPAGLPVIVVFDISPNVIDKSLGQKATMRWDVNHATHVVIDPGFGDVSHSGTRVLAPALGGHTYVLKATNAAGTITWTQHLDVRP